MPLTLGRLMGAIGGLALAFAFLPTSLSAALTVTVIGILSLDGMRLPLVTIGRWNAAVVSMAPLDPGTDGVPRSNWRHWHPK